MWKLEYVSEDDLSTFEGWARYQAIDLASLTVSELAMWRQIFADAVSRHEAAPKVGRMKLKRPGETAYAVAVPDGTDLWLALWVKRSAKGEYFIFHPTAVSGWDPHSSLHIDGTFHMKSYDNRMLVQKRQAPTSIKGSEHLGAYAGFSPKSVGAVCHRDDFAGVFEAPAGVLGPRNGMVTIDLIEPGSGVLPLEHPIEEVGRRIFTDISPHVLIRIFRS